MSGSLGPEDAARLDDGGILLFGNLRVTCQRCAIPNEHFHRTPPPSLGMLTVGKGADGDFFVPLAEDEAFWLGLTVPGAKVSFRFIVETKDQGRVNVHTGRPIEMDGASEFAVAGFATIHGIRRDTETFWPFQRSSAGAMPTCCRLLFSPHAGSGKLETSAVWETKLHLVPYEEFSSRTGLPPPPHLDLNAGYGGWLLP